VKGIFLAEDVEDVVGLSNGVGVGVADGLACDDDENDNDSHPEDGTKATAIGLKLHVFDTTF